MQETKAKYSISNQDIYNFNKTSFIIGIIYNSMIITDTNREDRYKILQLGNRE